MKKRGRLVLNRKAEITNEIYNVLIQIIIIIMILVACMSYLNSVKKNTLFEKMYLSRDVALMMNTIYAAPENVKVEYFAANANLSDYTFESKDYYVIVNEKGKDIAHAKYYKYATDLTFEEDFPLITNADLIMFLKNNNKVQVDEETPDTISDFFCSPVIPGNNDPYVIIDPGHGDNPLFDLGDPGYVTDDIQESTFTTQISEVLNAGFDYDVTRPSDYYITMFERLSVLSRADVIISIHLGNYSEQENAVKAFISAESEKKQESITLACHILNNFAKNSQFDVAIIPVVVSELSNEDPKLVLLADKVAVLLEIGNINNKESIELLDVYEIAAAINKGIKDYYEKDE